MTQIADQAAYLAGYANATDDLAGLTTALSAARFVLAERERELLELKGPCSTCPLHYAHSGPCAPTNRQEAHRA